MNQRLLRHWPLAILFAILLIAAAARFYRLGEPSLWEDERDSVMSAEGHFADWEQMPTDRIIPAPDLFSTKTANSWLATWRTPDFHPPLYAMLLRLWRDCFGESDTATRSLSAVVSLIAIVLLFDLVRTLTDAATALWASGIMALAEPQILFAQEARDYALWTALGLGAAAAAARLSVRGPGRRRAAALAGCAVGMMLTHFLAMATAAALGIWCAIYLRGRARRQAVIAGAVGLVVLIAVGSALPAQAFSASRDIGWARVGGGWEHAKDTLRQAAMLPADFLASPPSGAEDLCELAAVAYAICWLLCTRPRGANRNGSMLLCSLWLWAGVAPVAAADLIMGAGTIRYIRFTLIAAPAQYVLIASLPLRPILRAIAPLGAIIGCMAAAPYYYDALWKGDWRTLGDDLHNLVRPSDVIVFANPPEAYLAKPVQLYDAANCYLHPIPCRVLLLDRPADRDLANQLRAASHVWIVSTTPGVSLGDFLPGWQITAAAPRRFQAAQVWKAQ